MTDLQLMAECQARGWMFGVIKSKDERNTLLFHVDKSGRTRLVPAYRCYLVVPDKSSVAKLFRRQAEMKCASLPRSKSRLPRPKKRGRLPRMRL